ncbi:MAG: acylphosphatase [Fimbriimonas sp.]
MATKRMVVRGRVQGVGFRAFVQRTAEERGVVGQVWNRRDGHVELVAQHDAPEILEDLALRLRWGPGRVDGVDVYEGIVGNWSSFEVTYSR